jgi:site-specific recombinase XerC
MPDVPVDERLIPRWSPNRLRHARATEIRAQFGIESASTVLGHANVKTTEIYAEKDLQQAAEIMRRIG